MTDVADAFVRLGPDRHLDPQPGARCSQCAPLHGKERLELQHKLRCPNCDYPFGETLEATRALAFAVQSNNKYTNVYSQKGCYVWLQVVDGGWNYTLTVEGYDNADSFGLVPDWLSCELDNVSWADIIGLDDNMALQEGLCPGQPFLVEMRPPRWHKVSYEYNEHDVDYYWDITYRSPRSAKQAARAWEQWIKRRTKHREADHRATNILKHRREHGIKSMYIEYDVYWHGIRDEQSYPNGTSVRLCTNLGGQYICLAEGRAHHGEADGSYTVAQLAKSRLVTEIGKRLPHLSEGVIADLPIKG